VSHGVTRLSKDIESGFGQTITATAIPNVTWIYHREW